MRLSMNVVRALRTLAPSVESGKLTTDQQDTIVSLMRSHNGKYWTDILLIIFITMDQDRVRDAIIHLTQILDMSEDDNVEIGLANLLDRITSHPLGSI